MQHLYATGGRVKGSDQMRIGYRSQLWGTSLYLGPPSIWTTWNLNDIHEPVLEKLGGSNIDLDDFCNTAGLNSEHRSKLVAQNPYVCAKSFQFLVNRLLEDLLGIRCNDGRVHSEMGVLGKLSGYFGVVEAQGRGSLHLHMLLWLANAPSCDEMQELFKGEEFRVKVTSFIKHNIRAHLDGMETYEDIQSIPVEKEVGYDRPPNPDGPLFEERCNELERRLVRSQQIHKCTTATCLKMKNGQLRCKRKAPFPLADDDYVLENGKWGCKRTFGYMNGWSPPLMPVLRCNNDMKLITNGEETRDSGYYFLGYATKKQNKSHNQSALLADTFAYHHSDTAYENDIGERNRLLIIRCLNTLNKEQEISGPQAMSYLMGWDDVYRSHRYAPLYWSSYVSALLLEFPELRRTTNPAEESGR